MRTEIKELYSRLWGREGNQMHLSHSAEQEQAGTPAGTERDLEAQLQLVERALIHLKDKQ